MALPALIAPALAVSALVGSIFGFFPPLPTWTSRYGYRAWPSKIPELEVLIDLRLRNLIDDGEYLLRAREHGFNSDWAIRILYTAEQFLTVQDLITAWRRGLIHESILDIYLKAYRLSDDSIDMLKSVTEYFPSPADLIRFAVREVYSPTIRFQFGMDEDLPQRFLDEAKKAGLPDEQARNYWAAHWELPSILQGFEMLHRDVIKPEELNMLLRALDVMPFWRDKLIQISYNPLTRVDVRRMFDLGVLDEDGVYRAYKDVGYNDDNARLMTEFTKVYTSDEARGITRASVITAFKRDLITAQELQEYLKSMGYTDDIVSFWYTNAEYEKFTEGLDEQIDEWVSAYRLGEFSIEYLHEMLDTLDLPASFVNAIINKEQLKVSVKRKFPPLSDLAKWLETGVIDEVQFSEKMRMLGYKDEDIQSYLAQMAEVRDIETRKFLTVPIYQRWLKSEIMSEADFRYTLQAMNITEEDIDFLIIEARSAREQG